MLGRLILLGLLAAGPAAANEPVLAESKLSDVDFHRLVTCGAAKGKTCLSPRVRWRKRQLTVGMHADTGTMSPQISSQVSQALDAAINTINAVGAGITLTRDDSKRRPNIVLGRVSLREGERTKKTFDVRDGVVVGIGTNTVWWDGSLKITKATILISAHIQRRDIASVVLEELFQSLGFRHDVEGAYYHTRSILAENSNATTQIKGQDAAILRLHYPPATN